MEKGENGQGLEPCVLFVYGTLRKGRRNHRVLKRLRGRFLGEGSVAGTLYDLGSYPGASKEAGLPPGVQGEIYLLPNPARALTVLDKLEGFGPGQPERSEFRREKTTVSLSAGGRMQT